MAQSVSFGVGPSFEAARAAQAAYLRQREPDTTTDTRLAGLAAAQLGLTALGAVAGLFSGVKGRTAEEDRNKITLCIRNVTPYVIVFEGARSATKGEPVPVVVKPDDKAEWLFRVGRIPLDASDPPYLRLKIVKSATEIVHLRIDFADQSTSTISRTLRVKRISFDQDGNFDNNFVEDPHLQESASDELHVPFYTSTNVFPLHVFAVPLTNGADARLQVTILSPDPSPV